MRDEQTIVSKDEARIDFPAIAVNVGFARTAAAVFAARLDFTLEAIDEIKVAVSEAVSNAVIHAYSDAPGAVHMHLYVNGDDSLVIDVADEGTGIDDVEWAMQATHSRLPEEHMGLGFVFMNQYMDELHIVSQSGRGTRVTMVKRVTSREPGG